ncbi:hypothetical protein P0082_10985 [Candidatus Haliotispira prima]|uniref:RNA polymerase sigma-54 factor n=1 Tax=Candidatus Haliotispira prima TaxID=3034016 RepID=A0ABY8MII8_9SPIO|nr:hypothetical protein P0082_10985 [Candidatus Haliotispira prima]
MKQSLQQRQTASQEMRLNQFQQQSLHFLQSGVTELLSEIEEWQEKYPELRWKDGKPNKWEQGNVEAKKQKRYPGEWRLENQWQNGRFLSVGELAEHSDAKQQMLENYSDDDGTAELREVLREQMYLWNLNGEEKEFCELVLQNLDKRGLNLESPILIAVTLLPKSLSWRKKLAQLLRRIQELDPPGCACDSPLQSLTVQAELRYANSDLVQVLRSLNSLEMLGSVEDFLEHVHKLGFNEQKGHELLEDLQKLEPYPARGYRISNDSQNFRIYPEIQVQLREKTGTIEIELLNNLGAKLEIVPRGHQDGEERQELREAKVLLQQLQRREETLLHISQSIFSWQQAFVLGGTKDMQILTLQMVAEDLNFHVSTISRCIQGKYCKTPWGTYPMRFFFSQGPRSGQSREQIKERIADILQEFSLSLLVTDSGMEKKPKISDAELGRRLEGFGIQVARRTVAKYRAELANEGRL